MPIEAYCTIEGMEGPIEGSVQIAGRENTIEVVEFNHQVHIPSDRKSGRLTGVRQHRPAVITKAYDKSTPYLYKALTNGEELPSVIVRWYDIDDTGTEVNYFTHTYEQARISDIRSYMPSTKDPTMDQYTHMEDVSFVYESVEWLWEDGALTHIDAWQQER
jgi:type VI secretion system secreted protein Hcp